MKQLVNFIVDTIKYHNKESEGRKQDIIGLEPYIYTDRADDPDLIHVIDWLEYNGYKNVVQLYKSDGYPLKDYYIGISFCNGKYESGIFKDDNLIISASMLEIKEYHINTTTYSLLYKLREYITKNKLWNINIEIEEEKERIKNLLLSFGATKFYLSVYERGISVKDAICVYYIDDNFLNRDNLLIIKDDEKVIENVINAIARNRGKVVSSLIKDENIISECLGSRNSTFYHKMEYNGVKYRIYEML